MTAYNLSSFAGAGAQFFDDNGNPLSGGKVYTYTAGTTTPAATYTTSAGTVANTNPIILDAAGRTPNEIWLTIGTLYKFIVKTSTDVLVGTYDGIPSINDPYSINSLLGSITGTNTIAATATPTITAYANGATYSFIAANTNTNAVTISIDGLAAKSITKNGSAALTAGDIQAGKLTWIEYDGTTFQLLNNIVYGGSITNGNVVSLSTPLTVANGGTGASTLSANAVILGNGVAAVQTVAPGSAGNALVSNGTTWTAQPLGAPPVGGYSNLKVNTTSTTAIAVTANYLVLGATSGTYTATTVNVSISTATSGANGLDTGTIANSTWYSVWIIYNGTTVAGLLSTSATAPTLPSGYTYKARVGWVRYGTAALVGSIQYNAKAVWKPTTSGFPSLASGSATLWTSVSTSAAAPSTAGSIWVKIYNTTISTTTAVNSNNSPTNGYDGILSYTPASNYNPVVTLPAEITFETAATIYWYNTAASGALSAVGWTDNL